MFIEMRNRNESQKKANNRLIVTNRRKGVCFFGLCMMSQLWSAPNFYYTTAGSYIEMWFKPDSDSLERAG